MSARIFRRTVPSYWQKFTDLADQEAVRVSTFLASDNFELIVYEMGYESAPALMLVNPIHVPFLAFYKIASRLAGFFRVVSYEVRGSAFLPEYLGDFDAGLDRQSLDLAEIAKGFGKPDYFIGWCNSAKVIAWSTERNRISPCGVALISPSGTVGEEGQHLQRGTLFGPLQSLDDRQVVRARKAMAKAFNPPPSEITIESELMGRLFGMNFVDGARFRQYVRMKLLSTSSLPPQYAARRSFDAMCDATEVLLIRSELDQYIVSEQLQSVAARKTGTKIHTLAGADHAPTLSHWEEISNVILEFISR